MSIDNQTNTETHINTQPKRSKFSRVFMLEQSQNVDISPAQEYGRLIVLFKNTNSDNKMWRTEEFADEIIKELEHYNYDPEVDYLLVAGHVIPIVIFIATVVSEWENIQVLFWSSGFRKYVPRSL